MCAADWAQYGTPNIISSGIFYVNQLVDAYSEESTAPPPHRTSGETIQKHFASIALSTNNGGVRFAAREKFFRTVRRRSIRQSF